MELKTLEQAKSIREKKKELESKIADIAKSDPERAKKMSIALTVLSWKADRMIGDGLGGDKEMVALAPREEPISAPVASKPYVARIKKAISAQPIAKNKTAAPVTKLDPVKTVWQLSAYNQAYDMIPTLKRENDQMYKKQDPVIELWQAKNNKIKTIAEIAWFPAEKNNASKINSSLFEQVNKERQILNYWKTTTMDPNDTVLQRERYKNNQQDFLAKETMKNNNKIKQKISELENEKKQKFVIWSSRPWEIDRELSKLRNQLR